GGGGPSPFAGRRARYGQEAPGRVCCGGMFHAAGAGYGRGGRQLVPARWTGLGEWVGDAALAAGAADTSTLLTRLGAVSRLWRRSTGVPAPIVVHAG
ncbi:SGNH/GDSL hydrolase family protein, partial [Mycolicibacterium porcinum]